MDDLDIHRRAKQLIEQYGLDASVEAARMAELMLSRDNTEGYALWLQLGSVIEELQDTTGGMRH